MTTKYDTYYCPCGCGNHREEGDISQNFIDHMRKLMKDRRYCMEPETTKIFLATLEDIQKHGYKTVGKYSLVEFLEDAETEHDKWALTSLYRTFTISNAYADSEDNTIQA